MMQRSFEQRYIPLEKVTNARDMGGYETRDGNYTRVNRFIRSSSLSQATSKDIRELKEYGVTCIIDMRSLFEVQHQPTIFQDDKDIEYHHIQLLQDVTLSLLPDNIKSYSSVAGYYIYAIEANKETIKKIFTIFASHHYNTILFNCSAGKDRTGIIAALLLHLAGCYKEDIVKDYCVTYQYNESMYKSLEAVMEEDKKQFLQSKPEYMEDFLTYIEDTYGSAKGYLISCGMDQEDIELIIEDFVI